MYLFLPKSILKINQSIFAKCLRGGTKNQKCQYKVAWVECCLPKQARVLGIRNLGEWNTAAIYYELERIIQPNNTSLWCSWFNKDLLRNKAFWTTKLPYRRC